MKTVYVLVIKPEGKCIPEEVSTVVADNVDKLIDYVVNEELPEWGWSEEDIINMGVETELAENLCWKDKYSGYDFIINESSMI